ncbi:hypothetical protein JXA63_01655 [Candidatus Woesebacteria bacterium]|nr:hypothetical protein [Candidatus Woesebacteria bacterium]
MSERIENSPAATPIGQVCRMDTEEREFRHLVGDWVDGNISYDTLMRNYPSHRMSLPARVLRKFKDLI